MPIDLATLQKARKLNRDAVEEVVNDTFPAVARIAYGLTGRDDAGNAVIRYIIRRGLKNLPKWRDEGEPERWFLHHTIIQSRRERRRPMGENDLLIQTSPQQSPQYIAFIRALRALPYQQVEAFILHHGESFNLRYLAVAMDCSTKAAEQHLSAATSALRAIAGDSFDALTLQLRRAYQKLSPADRVQVPQVGKIVRLHVWPRRLWRIIKFLVTIAFVAAAGWFAWKILPAIEY